MVNLNSFSVVLNGQVADLKKRCMTSMRLSDQLHWIAYFFYKIHLIVYDKIIFTLKEEYLMNERKNYTIIDAGESMMLAVFLILALTIVILTGYNMVTCLVYIAPCLVFTWFEGIKFRFGTPMFWISMIAFILSIVAFGLIVAYKHNGPDWITYTLAIYPLYQLIYTGYIKSRLDA